MDLDLARFAIQAYSDRNDACHSAIAELKVSGDWHGLAQHISRDLEELQTILPSNEQHHYDNWRALLVFYRGLFFKRDPITGDWVPKGSVSPALTDVDMTDAPVGPLTPSGNVPAEAFEDDVFKRSQESVVGDDLINREVYTSPSRGSPKRKAFRGLDLGSPSKKIKVFEDADNGPSVSLSAEEKLLSAAHQLVDGTFKEIVYKNRGKANHELDKFKSELKSTHAQVVGPPINPKKAEKAKRREARRTGLPDGEAK